MKLNNLRDLLIHDLQDIYDAEMQITKALPMMAEAATSAQVRQAFEDHLVQTQNQVRRLEQVFKLLGEKAQRQECKGIRGLIEEGEKMMAEDASPEVRDAALIASAQKVEHYEIAAYGTARAYARILGEDSQIDALLLETLDEEGQTDERLNQLAMTRENIKAKRA
jgi:ferritin-like metal-binding protein YciE